MRAELKELARNEVKMKKFLSEFKQFAMKSDVIQLAVGVILGAAVNSVVKSLTSDIFMPVIGLFVGKINISSLAITIGNENGEPLQIKYGSFLQSLLDFLVTALCIFLMVKLIKKLSEFSFDKVKEVVKTEILKVDDKKEPQETEVPEATQTNEEQKEIAEITKDSELSNELLTEIRDLLKKQNEITLKSENSLNENK